MGLEKWWTSDPSECEIWGGAVFGTFQQAFDVLVSQSLLKCRTFLHPWYTEWPWLKLENANESFFTAIDATLNDNIICEIIKYIDPLHLLHFASINERFNGLAEMRHLRIFPSTVGTIGLMNFRFLLEKFGSTVINISLSLTSFHSSSFCFSHTKCYILNIIYWFTGRLLKKVRLFDYDLDDNETEKIGSIKHLFDERGIELIFSSN